MNDNQECYASLQPSPYKPLVILAIVGIVAVLFSTTWGVGISPDSVTYVDVARNLLTGHGLSIRTASSEFRPMTHYPPLFPTLLAAPGIFGVDPLNGARWANAVIFGVNILLVGLAVYRYTDGTAWLALLGSFLMLTSFNMLLIHSTAITEPLFILFTLAGLLLLDMYVEKIRPLLLVLSAGAVALGFLTRYAGGALVITGTAVLILLSKRTLRKRITDTACFILISCSPVLLWGWRNKFVAGSMTNRQLVFHPISQEQLNLALDTFSRWFIPFKTMGIVRDIVVLAAIVALLSLGAGPTIFKKLRPHIPSREVNSRFPYVFVFFIAFYLGFLLISLSFFDAYTPLDARILSPIFVSGLTVVLHLLHKLLRSVQGTRYAQTAILSLCVLFAASYLGSGTVWIMRSHGEGRGYASKSWQQSEIIADIRSRPEGTLIYSNGQDAIYMLTGRFAYGIPAKFNAVTLSPHDNYPVALNAMREELQKNDGLLVYFDTIDWRDYYPSEDEIVQDLSVEMIMQSADGAIYRAKLD